MKTGRELPGLVCGSPEADEGILNSVSALAVLPGAILASASSNAIRLWDMKSGAELAKFEGGAKTLVALSDGSLVTASYGDPIGILGPKIGAELAKFGALVTASYKHPIRILNPKTGAELAKFGGHKSSINTLAALPDGNLASGSDDKTIRLWNTKTGTEITQLEVDAAVKSLVALPDGRLVAGDQLGRLHWLEFLD